MSYLEKYTEEEWKIISCLPQGIGYLMGGAGNENLFGSVSEKMIISTLLLDAWKEYPDNNLIKNIITNPENINKFLENAKSHLSHVMFLIEKHNIKTTENFTPIILNDCEKALEIIKTKEDQKGGERFSQEEQHIYKKLELILK